ncbi:MAG: ATP-binding protein [Bacteroidales bacterium]|nr:ATP-binding protein [Bacteroidales bacterium]
MKRIYEYEELQPIFDQLLQDKESSEIEFKTAAGGFPKSFWETYSSFANTNGGAIIFGIKEKDGTFYLDGLTKEHAQKLQHDFFNGMHSNHNVNIALLTEKDVQDVEYDGAHFLFFYVPRVDCSLRPVYVGLDPYTGSYRRDMDGDYHCSRAEVNSMFADANLSTPADGRILKNFSKEDLDANSVRQYRRKFEQYNPDHVWNALPDDEFLKKINVFRTDRKTGEHGITYAGLLMFGTYSAIMDENPNFFPDFQEIENGNERWSNRICPDGNWESNLFQFYSRVLPTLQNYLPKPFQLEGNSRKNETSGHVAIREAFVNALVHADYTVNASLSIHKCANQITFANPGTLLISIKQYYQGGESVCRNKYLQNMFMFLSAAEKAGSGTDKIIQGWRNLKWKRPYIQERTRPNKVVLTLPMESLLDESIISRITELLGKEIINNLSQVQLQILALAATEEEITNERLQYALQLHRTDISILLSKMCKENLIIPSGYGRGTRYRIVDNSTAPKNSNSLNASETLNGDTSGANGTLARLYSKEKLQALVEETCIDWMTAEDIAKAIGRTIKHVKSNILPQMESILEKKFNTPHHPRQMYRTKKC